MTVKCAVHAAVHCMSLGHGAAIQQPRTLVGDIAQFCRSPRQTSEHLHYDRDTTAAGASVNGRMIMTDYEKFNRNEPKKNSCLGCMSIYRHAKPPT